jgi:hypothetical protein
MTVSKEIETRTTKSLALLDVSELEDQYETLGLVVVRVYVKFEWAHRTNIGQITSCLNVLEGLLSELKRQALLSNPTDPKDDTTILGSEGDHLALAAPVIVRRINYYNPLETILSIAVTEAATIAVAALIKIVFEELVKLGNRLTSEEPKPAPAVSNTVIENMAISFRLFQLRIVTFEIERHTVNKKEE